MPSKISFDISEFIRKKRCTFTAEDVDGFFFLYRENDTEPFVKIPSGTRVSISFNIID